MSEIESCRERLPHPCWVRRRLFGADFEVDASGSVTQSLLYLWGEHFIVERRLISGLLDPGMHAVDVGANLGYYLLLLEQSVGPKGHVTLIEPSQENLPALQRNIALNGYSNVVLHPVAVGARPGRVGLRSGINSGVTDLAAGAYTVEVQTLDALVDRPVDFLKIDVEGFEGQVLEGAQRILERDHPVLFLELHPHIIPRFGHSVASILSLVRDVYGDAVEFYRDTAPDIGALARILSRYGLADPVQQIADPFAVSERLAQDETGTLWCIAGRRV